MSETTLCQIDLGALFKFKIKFGGVIDFNNKLNKFMNGSPFRTFDSSSQHFVTPSRKTTPHHCNADKKIMPVCSIELTDLSGLSRNLFGEDLSNRPANNYLNINAKLFRWPPLIFIQVTFYHIRHPYFSNILHQYELLWLKPLLIKAVRPFSRLKLTRGIIGFSDKLWHPPSKNSQYYTMDSKE